MMLIRNLFRISPIDVRRIFSSKMATEAKKLSRTEKQMMKSLDRHKLEEMNQADRIRRRANVMAFGLFALVVGIYTYTIRKMGQDHFLDDDEPLIKQ